MTEGELRESLLMMSSENQEKAYRLVVTLYRYEKERGNKEQEKKLAETMQAMENICAFTEEYAKELVAEAEAAQDAMDRLFPPPLQN